MISNICRRSFTTGVTLLGKRTRLDYSKVPTFTEADLEEKFIKGWGPGGQAVNKTTNAVFLKHIPTGIWIKCQDGRSLDRNRKIARTLLTTKLDNEINGEDSVENQEKVLTSFKKELNKEKTRLKYQLRRELKEAEKGAEEEKVGDVEEKVGEDEKEKGKEKDGLAARNDEPNNKENDTK